MKAVIFDVDGTLLDSVDLHALAWRKAFNDFGIESDYLQIRDQIGKSADDLMPVFMSKDEIATFGNSLREHRDQIFRDEYMDKVAPFPYVRDLVKCVKEHDCLVALASSAKKADLDVYVKMMDIEDLVDCASSADDADRAKPNPDTFQIVLDKLDVRPEEAIVVGGSPYDAEAATKAKMKTVGMCCGGFPVRSLINSGVVALFKDPGDLFQHYDISPISL